MYSFPILNQFIFPYPASSVFLTCIQVYQEAGKVSGGPISLRIFHLFVVVHAVKGFSVVNEVDVFLEIPCFLYDPTNIGNLISSSSAFSQPSLYI